MRDSFELERPIIRHSMLELIIPTCLLGRYYRAYHERESIKILDEKYHIYGCWIIKNNATIYLKPLPRIY